MEYYLNCTVYTIHVRHYLGKYYQTKTYKHIKLNKKEREREITNNPTKPYSLPLNHLSSPTPFFIYP